MTEPTEPDAPAVGVGAIRIAEDTPHGRVIVTDSLSYCDERMGTRDVVVGASFCGAATVAIPISRGCKAVIAHDAGVGKDEAGISALPFCDPFGIPVAAVEGRTASLSNGNSLYEGRISHANESAKALGVRSGQPAAEAALLMLRAPEGRAVDTEGLIDFSIHEMETTPSGRVIATWTLIHLPGQYPNDVFALATHSARVGAEHAVRWNVKGWLANDAGMGKNNSGIGGLPICDEHGIAAAAVSAMSARIADALSTYHEGIISAANATATSQGVEIGMPAAEALHRMVMGSRD